MRTKNNLPKVISFEQNAHYYFEKGNHYYQQNKLQKALLFYKKTIEMEPENSLYHYNLACLLSRMGYLEKANEMFASIVHDLDPALTECYFLMAVNYGLLDELEKARIYLNLYLQFSPEGEMVEDAEELLFALSEEGMIIAPPPEENVNFTREIGKEEEELSKSYQESQSLRSYLWGKLYNRNEQIAEKAIHMYGLLNNKAGEQILKEFVRNPWIKQRLRLQALLELKNMGIRGLVTVHMDGEFKEVDLLYYPLLAPRWMERWQEVLDCTLENMRHSKAYNELFYEDLQAIWIDYLNNIYPETPFIKKKETWAASLEYALAKYHFLNVTQKKLAEQYGVSSSSISNRYNDINNVLNIEHRAYHNMLRYLTQREKE